MISKSSRAQASAELLIILGALAAFFAVLAPAAAQAVGAAKAAAAMQAQQVAVEKIAALAGQTALLAGSTLEERVWIAVESEFRAADGRVTLEFEAGGKNKTVEREAPGVAASSEKLSTGEWIVRASSGRLGFSHEK
ncbi:MAG: hypothetical protein V1708_00845 [Candidatus Micrarchaeota archaeon]